MKAWRVHAWGEPETMTLDEVEMLETPAGQVRIRNHAAALNFFDILQVQGKYQVKPPFPFTPGAEVAGVVDAVGWGVTSVKEGDRVMAIPRGGAFAEYSLAPEASTFAMPEAMSFEAAASIPIVYQTGYFAFTHRYRIREGEWLLVHAGASGVGMAAIQIGKALGAKVIATAGSAAKLAFAREQGADHAVDYTDAGWVDRVKEITHGHGADTIYDPVGGDIFDLSTKCVAGEGRILIIGFAAGRIPSIALNRVLLKNISIVGVLWGGYVISHPDYERHAHAELMKWYEAGKLKPSVNAVYPFREAPRGLRDLAERKVRGKAVLTFPAR
jgi:NADPH2:quinone reductase